ncbi:MAG TPA: nuclear transport factor 2 family protein [Gemmatimonadales bacterium]|nr:nuclear transport factor 2 family protein [Gemmatimonadales bacterium]
MTRVSLAAAVALLAVAPMAPLRAQAADELAVGAVVRAFHDALMRGDSLAALALLAPDARVLESGGLETREEYRSHHLPADIAFTRAVPGQRTEPTIVVVGDVAWTIGASRSTGEYRGRPVDSAGVELMVLAREATGWRIRAIHWSSRAIRAP